MVDLDKMIQEVKELRGFYASIRSLLEEYPLDDPSLPEGDLSLLDHKLFRKRLSYIVSIFEKEKINVEKTKNQKTDHGSVRKKRETL